MSLSTDPRLGLLPEFEPRSSSFTASTLANVTAAVVFVFVAMSGIHEHVEIPMYAPTELIFPVPAASAETVAAQTPKAMEKSRAKVHAAPAPHATFHFQMLAAIPAGTPSPVGNQVAMALAKTDPKPILGAFGDPMGVTPNPTAKTGTIQRVGNFDAPVAANQRSGSSPSGSVQTVGFGSSVTIGGPGVTSGGNGKTTASGFGSGVAAAGEGRGHGSVATTAFNSGVPGPASAERMVARSQDASFEPPVVMFEPLPQYTAEARSLKIQGQVVLEVRMGATGKIDILRIVNGLGHGLDEEAATVTRHIKFKPAMKNGQALDQVTLVHVFFRLA